MKSVSLGLKGVVRPRFSNLFAYCFGLLLVILSCSLVGAQGSSFAGRGLQSVAFPTDLAPSKPYAAPGTSGPQFGGSSDLVPFSSEMVRNWLPIIPNLQFGFNYLFGRNLSQSWWTADYVLPLSLTRSDIVFGEAHVDSANSASTGGFPFLNNFWQQGPAGLQNRIDLSFGLGYRKLFGNNALLGVYGFYDSTRLSGSWRSAGSIGVQAAANGPGDSAVDLNINYYSDAYVGFDSRGSVFPTYNLFGAIAHGEGNYDLEAGVSQPFFNHAYDLRAKLAGYRYDLGNSKVHGLRTGADVTTADGVFKVSAEYGNDRLIGQYGQIGAYVNIGFQAENIVKGESPFTKPEPIFKSPRHLRQLASQPAKRNWRKPSAVIANAKCEGTPDDSQFATPKNKACFYSGTGASAKCRSESLVQIGDTPGGQWTQTYTDQYPTPFGQPSIYNYTTDIEPMFKCSSAAFARMASGPVTAYVGYSQWYCTSSIFWTVELPTLTSRGITPKLYTNTAGAPNTWTEVPIPNCGF